jgi:hypothetical protein
MKPRTIRKMQVPAYWPRVVGAQLLEKRGVLVLVKKTMFMFMFMLVDMEEVSEVEDEAEELWSVCFVKSAIAGGFAWLVGR